MRLRFRCNALALGAMVVALVAAGVSRVQGNQQQAFASIGPSGELLRLEGGSLSLPPPNGPGAIPSGTVTAKLSVAPPAGRPKLAHVLAYLSFGSDATIDMTGGIIVTIKPGNARPCTGVQTSVAFLGGSGWESWEKHFGVAELGCDLSGNYVATLYPRGALRLAPGSPIVLAILRGHAPLN
jgi:hypothetical protein